MNKNPESPEVGEIFHGLYGCEVLTWEIPNVSHLEITEYTELRSPLFSYRKARWVLKLLPFGRTKSGIVMKIERLHSEIPEHNFYCKTFAKSQNIATNGLTDFQAYHTSCNMRSTYTPVKFNLEQRENDITSDNEWYSVFYHKREYRWNDTITLVVEILSKENDASDFETDSTEETSDSSNNVPEEEWTVLDSGIEGLESEKKADISISIGKLSIESFDVIVNAWKLPRMSSIYANKVIDKVQSPAFSFSGASWILKLFLRGQTEFQSHNVDVVIERFNSQTEKQALSYEIFFDKDGDTEYIIKHSSCHIPAHCAVGSFTFDFDHEQENIFNILDRIDCIKSGFRYLVSQFRIPRKTEIVLNFQAESLESLIHLPEVGRIIKNPFECDVITWTIPCVSSVLVAEGFGKESPQFSYNNATWNLEIHPYGSCYPVRKGNMGVLLKRLHSEFVHKFFCRMLIKDLTGNLQTCYSGSVQFDSKHEQKSICWDMFDIITFHKHYRHNDTLTLVLEIYREKDCENVADSQEESLEADLSNTDTKNVDSSNSVGELFFESFDIEMVTWEILVEEIFANETEEDDYGLKSSNFSFADSDWILNMFPFGRKTFKSTPSADVLIARISASIPQHLVSYRIFFDLSKELIEENVGISLENLGRRLGWETRGSTIFDVNSEIENVCCVGNLKILHRHRSFSSVFLVCDFRVKSNCRIKMNCQKKLAKVNTDSSKDVFEEQSTESDSTSQDLSENMLEEELAELASTSQDPAKLVIEEESTELYSSSQGPSTNAFEEVSNNLDSTSEDPSKDVIEEESTELGFTSQVLPEKVTVGELTILHQNGLWWSIFGAVFLYILWCIWCFLQSSICDIST